MVKAMKLRDVEQAPRHKTTSPGVVRSTMKRMTCLPEGWLQ